MLFKITLFASLIMINFHGTLQKYSDISTIKLPDGFKKGQTAITIYGSTTKNSNRFNINLRVGTGESKGDVSLHMSVSFEFETVVLNAFKNNKWTNNRKQILETPFETGEKFVITIRIGEENYQISVNGEHYVDFPYHLPPEKLTHLTIDGEVDVRQIFFKGNLVKVSENDYPAEVITTFKIPDDIELGKTLITITGTPNENSDRFSINLQEGPEWHKGDIGLRMVVRYDSKEVIFNAIKDNKWNSKDRIVKEKHSAFQVGKEFILGIKCLKPNYEMKLNGYNYQHFHYRVPIEKLTHLQIDGNVDVRNISIKGLAHDCENDSHSD